VLDIGCGTGKLTRELAHGAARDGSVLGVDLSSQMLGRAREAASAEGLTNTRFEQADAQVHPFELAELDLAVSSFGVMFFADPVAAFTNIRRALRPGGRVALLAWRDLERNEWVATIRAALAAGRDLPTPPAGTPGPFGLADRTRTEAVFAKAGYGEVALESIDLPLCLGTDADDAFSFVRTFGVTRGLLQDLDEARAASALDELHRALVAHETSDGVLFAGSAWLITARV
jgi:SAM-dependent methyltransferase